MKNKFKFLTKDSIKRKINTKSFKITNLVLFIVIAILINLDSIVKLFGGDFDKLTHVYIVDEMGIYDDVDETMKNSYLDVLNNYNAEVEKSDKKVSELKKEIIKDESDDIIVHITKSDSKGVDKIFNAEIISYDYIDTVLYQNIVNALNTVKSNLALERSNIDQDTLNDIYKSVDVKRTLLDENLNENEELMEKIGGIIIIIFIVPFFLLIVLIIQMIGAEINEEKSTKSMEVIISSVKPEIHFLSKLISANVFAIVQGLLLIFYVIVGVLIRVATTGIPGSDVISSNVSVSSISQYINMFLQSDIASRLVSGIPFFILLMLFSFFAYSLFIGVLASMTTNMEDYNQILTPVMIFLMIGYYLAIYASVYQGALFIKIAAFIPFISGILAPVMYTIGEMSLLDLGISILLLIGTCGLLYKYGLKIYKAGILNYSSSNLWKKMFKSLKD